MFEIIILCKNNIHLIANLIIIGFSKEKGYCFTRINPSQTF